MSQPEIAPQPSGGLTASLAATSAHGRDVVEATVRTWAAESGAFLDDLAKDNATAVEGFRTCRGPLDVLLVEQKWLSARSKSWADAWLRLWVGAMHESETAAAKIAAFRLPE
jgi:hypothetical protein